jgi:hypothetical protein
MGHLADAAIGCQFSVAIFSQYHSRRQNISVARKPRTGLSVDPGRCASCGVHHVRAIEYLETEPYGVAVAAGDCHPSPRRVNLSSMPQTARASLPLPRTAISFRPEYLDFERGIHVGNLDDTARITRILKLELEAAYDQPFVTERYGRGVYWQWIGYVPRANREAKPLSSKVSFGCSKLFLMVDTKEKLFKCGLQVERGLVKPSRKFQDAQLLPDWDWHRLVDSLKPRSMMEGEIQRLLGSEEFHLRAGTWVDSSRFSSPKLPSARTLRRLLTSIAANEWGFFQLYYAMDKDEVRGSAGLDLVESMLAIFREVTPAMNLCMQIRLEQK